MSYKEARDKAAEEYNSPYDTHGSGDAELDCFKAGYDAGFQAPEVLALIAALNWIAAIRISPGESWPSHETIAEIANDALEEWGEK